jgi:hypothetical protein
MSMARRKRGAPGNAAQQTRALDFSQQSSAKPNFALSAARATAGQSGNTGRPAISDAYDRRYTNESNVGIGTGKLGKKDRVKGMARRGRKGKGQHKDSPQRPFVSFRQYGGSPAAAQ